MVELNEQAAGRAVAVVSGEQVRVTLGETGGTGYRWRAGTSCDALLHLDQESRGDAATKPGGSSTRMWTYTATSVGSCDMRFELVRSWEKTVTGKTVSFPVTVGKVG